MLTTTRPIRLHAAPAEPAAPAECEALADRAGLPLVFVPPGGRPPIACGEVPPWVPADAFSGSSCSTATATLATATSVALAAVPCSGGLAVSILPRADAEPPAGAAMAAAEAGWSNDRFRAWWDTPFGDAAGAARRLQLASELADCEARERRLEWELESMAEQIDSTFEEITLLHYLAQNLHVSADTKELAAACLTRMRDSLACGGAAAFLQGAGRPAEFLVDGDAPVDEVGLAMLLCRHERHAWPQPLVLNHLEKPGLDNAIVVPVMRGGVRSGWLACFNAGGGREFGTVEASLVASVATSLGTHLRNAAVVHEQDDMLLSFVRSLVSSLDAKDPYTRGHSERVASIGRRLAEELGLPRDEVESIYLSGLLHDVGKIGVPDGVLRKPGRLTDDEFAEIQRHPALGYQILGGIARLKHILPGVRSHHESMDGTGYPDGLSGEAIPLMARVLAVADSYDAMGSDRPYRDGMPLAKLESILEGGRDTQWDAAVVDAYFACRDDVLAICNEWTAREAG